MAGRIERKIMTERIERKIMTERIERKIMNGNFERKIMTGNFSQNNDEKCQERILGPESKVLYYFSIHWTNSKLVS